MEIQYTIFKVGKGGGDTGRIKNLWTLRFSFKNDLGQKKTKKYQFPTRNDAVDSRASLEAELKKTHGKSVIGGKMTFSDLAKVAQRTFYKEAEIVEGRTIEGVKSHQPTSSSIKTLIEYFGEKRIKDISAGDLRAYKSWRVKQGNRSGKQAKLKAEERKPIRLSTVNRELTIMKRMMRHALVEGWIVRDIFANAKGVIDKDAETAKSRTLTEAEETMLLAVCEPSKKPITFTRNNRGLGKKKEVTQVVETGNPYLKAMILLALDSAMRRGEILKLSWNDIDLEGDLVHILGTHTKTAKPRTVLLSDRAKAELMRLPNFGTMGDIFPFTEFKGAWKTALRLAGINGLGFHDLRRTAITQMNLQGIPLAIAGKIAGHATLSTTQKHYVSIDDLAIIKHVKQVTDAAIAKRLGSSEGAMEFVN